MARARYRTVIETTDAITGFLRVVPNPVITVFEANTTTPISETIYQNPTGGTTYTNPFTSPHADGSVVFYLDYPKEVTIRATGVGLGTITLDYEKVDHRLPFMTWYRVYHVDEYGAVPSGAVDSTDAIIATRDAIVANFATTSYGAIMQYGSGAYRCSEPINFQSMYGVIVRGHGPNNSVHYTLTRGDKWAGLHVFSFANSSNCVVRDMDIRNDQSAVGSGENLPDSLILWAQGAGGGSNANLLDNVRLEGATRYAPHINFGVPSSGYHEVDIYQRGSDPLAAISNDTDESSCVILMRTNVLGITANDGQAIHSAADGSRVTDLTFTQCELHQLVAADHNIARSNGQAFWQHNTGQIKFRDGNMSSSGSYYVRQTGGPTASIAAFEQGCQTSLFDGATFYTEQPFGPTPLAPPYFLGYDTPPGVASPAMRSQNTHVVNCRVVLLGAPSAGASDAAMFFGAAGTLWDHLTCELWEHNESGYIGDFMLMANHASNELRAPNIDAHNFDINVGASGTITDARNLRNYGTLTASAVTGLHPLDLVTTAGDLLEGTGARNMRRVAIGTGNQALYNISGALGWGPSVRSVITTAGDIIVGTGAAAFARLGIGAGNEALYNIGGTPGWGPSLRSIITTAGDLAVGTGAATFARLAKGADNTVLQVIGGALTWVADLVVSGYVQPAAAASTPTANVLYRQSGAKGWAVVTHPSTVNASFNVSSVTDNGTGDTTITWDRDFASTAYVAVADVQVESDYKARIANTSFAAGATRIYVTDSTGTKQYGNRIHVLAFGLQ